jgi:putative nucleotidyltransferase with HDIG domain
MTDIKEIISEIDILRPIPPVATQILELAEDINSSLSEIADLISHDPAITANVLKMCNSAYFGLSRRVGSVSDAIVLLGLDHVVDLVLMNSLSCNFKQGKNGYGLGEGELWRHAVLSAHITEMLVENTKFPVEKHLVFTAALVKDIGKMILGRYVAFSYEKINILVNSHGYSFNEAEMEIIGMSHEQLGALIAKRWRFSEKLVYIIRHHHLSEDAAREDKESSLVYLADIVCMMLGMSTGVDGLAYRFYSDVLKRMHISANDLHEVIAQTDARRSKIENLLRMI